jgi:hypothetical protein
VALTVKNVPGPPNGDCAGAGAAAGRLRLPGEAVEAGFPTAFTGKAEAATLETNRYRQFPTRAPADAGQVDCEQRESAGERGWR